MQKLLQMEANRDPTLISGYKQEQRILMKSSDELERQIVVLEKNLQKSEWTPAVVKEEPMIVDEDQTAENVTSELSERRSHWITVGLMA